MKAAIPLGQGQDGRDVLLDLPELLATRLLVQGNSGSGKSHLLRRLLEQTATIVQQVVIDPEGDFIALAERYGHLIVDAADQSDTTLRAAGERARVHRASVILTLESLDAERQLRAVAAFLTGMFEVARSHWYPVLVIVDEAQLFAPASGGDTTDEARRLSLNAMTNLMCRGRKRGLAGVIATQRLAKLAKNVAAEASNFLMGRTFLDIDMVRAADLLGMEKRLAEGFRDLARGQFMALGPALSRRPIKVMIGAVETRSMAAGPELLPFEAMRGEELRDIILEPVTSFSAPSPREPRPPAPDLLRQLEAYKAERQKPSDDALRQDFALLEEASPEDIWTMVRAVSAESEAATRPLPALFQDFQLRARISQVDVSSIKLDGFRLILGGIRAGVDYAYAQSTIWAEAVRIAAILPEDVQGVGLLLAHAAQKAAPCPRDAEIAAAYGTFSLGRARRQLTYLQEQHVIVVQESNRGRRVAFIGTEWQTDWAPA